MSLGRPCNTKVCEKGLDFFQNLVYNRVDSSKSVSTLVLFWSVVNEAEKDKTAKESNS